MNTISLTSVCERWGQQPAHARVTLHRAGIKPVNPGRRGHLRYRLEDVERIEAAGRRRSEELDPWAVLSEAEALQNLARDTVAQSPDLP